MLFQEPYNQVLNEALRRIYAVYGPNLAAFFRDVQAERERQREENHRGRKA